MNLYRLAAAVMTFLFTSFFLGTSVFAYSINDLTGAIDWQLGMTNVDSLNPLQVNRDHMFDYDDWIYLEKIAADEQEVAISVGLDIDNGDDGWDSISGIWRINDDAWQDYNDFMIVLKAADRFVGYLLDSNNMPTSGTWNTNDFLNKNSKPQALSHITIYGRGYGHTPPEITQNPEPATMILFGFGLLGIAGISRRNIRK